MAGRTPYPLAARELLRKTLLDALGDELRRHPMANVTMADVASTAGVSRQTLYKEFGSREELLMAFAIREVDNFLAPVEAALVANLDDPRTALENAFADFQMAAGGHPLHDAVLEGEGNEELMRLFTKHGGPVLRHAVIRLVDVILEGWSVLQREDAQHLAEAIVRLAVTMAVLPESPSGMTASSVAEMLAPYLMQLLRG